MYESFRQLVKEARTRAGLNQEELAGLVGKTKAWIVDIERGKVKPTEISVLQELARALKVDVSQLIGQVLRDRNMFRDDFSVEDWEIAGENRLREQEIRDAEPMTYKAIEERAEALASQLFPTVVADGLPLPVTRILGRLDEFRDLAKLGAPLAIETNSATDLEGSTTFEDGRFVVRIRSTVWAMAMLGDGRSRFTVAHELGHVVLHGAELKAGRFQAFRDSVCTASQKLMPNQPIYRSPEWQSNSFAGAMLMPGAAVQRYLSRCQELDEVFSVKGLAENFNVSSQAAAIRLQKLLPRLVAGTTGQPR